MSIDPLVTVGIPTYNRAVSLARALASICAQSYRHLEIIVSDNASTDENVERVVRYAMSRDDRVVYHRHPQNLGAMENFASLVSKGSGEFFMWAADDDRWNPRFIEKCIAELVRDPKLVVCQMEVQYETAPDQLFPFFAEGCAFYELSAESRAERVKCLLGHVYGNLVYGVFRREALFYRGRPVIEWIGRTLNEIPMQVLFASRGGIRVLPQIGMYKAAPKNVCEQARWEQVGGWLPNWPGWRAHLTACRSHRHYHGMVLREAFAAIRDLDCNRRIERALCFWAAFYLLRHEFFLAIRWRPAVSQGTRRHDRELDRETSIFQ